MSVIYNRYALLMMNVPEVSVPFYKKIYVTSRLGISSPGEFLVHNCELLK